MKTNETTPLAAKKSQTSSAKWTQRTLIGAGIAFAVILVATPVVPLVLWTCFLYVGNFWQNNLAGGSIPEYLGTSLTIDNRNVVGIAVGFNNAWPSNLFLRVDNQVRKVSEITVSDAISLGMERKPSIITSVQYSMGPIHRKSFANFDGDHISAFYACHGDFKFSKSPDGPFFSLPIAFDEYQKMFGKPIRWRREKSDRRVP